MLSTRRIADLLDRASDSSDPLIITPTPDIGALRKSGAASVDLRLGTWLMVPRHTRVGVLGVLESSRFPRSESEIMKRHYVRFGDYFVLHPGNFLLAATLEWIRLPVDLGGYIMGRSSWGRRGLIIATAVGVHPGFTGCLTLELTNVGEMPIEVRPGMSICQLFLHDVIDGESVERSVLSGSRRPSLGKVNLDPIAEALGKADSR